MYNKKFFLNILSVVFVLVGSYFILNSTKIGYKLEFDSDPERSIACLRLYAESYRLFGGILLTVGLINNTT